MHYIWRNFDCLFSFGQLHVATGQSVHENFDSLIVKCSLLLLINIIVIPLYIQITSDSLFFLIVTFNVFLGLL